MYVRNQHGDLRDFDNMVNLMDDEIREALNMELAPCADQEFYDAYAKAHLKKYGEEWVADMYNGQF